MAFRGANRFSQVNPTVLSPPPLTRQQQSERRRRLQRATQALPSEQLSTPFRATEHFLQGNLALPRGQPEHSPLRATPEYFLFKLRPQLTINQLWLGGEEDMPGRGYKGVKSNCPVY